MSDNNLEKMSWVEFWVRSLFLGGNVSEDKQSLWTLIPLVIGSVLFIVGLAVWMARGLPIWLG